MCKDFMSILRLIIDKEAGEDELKLLNKKYIKKLFYKYAMLIKRREEEKELKFWNFFRQKYTEQRSALKLIAIKVKELTILTLDNTIHVNQGATVSPLF